MTQFNIVVAYRWPDFQQRDPTLFWLNLIRKKMPQCTLCCSAFQFSITQPQNYNRTYCTSIYYICPLLLRLFQNNRFYNKNTCNWKRTLWLDHSRPSYALSKGIIYASNLWTAYCKASSHCILSCRRHQSIDWSRFQTPNHLRWMHTVWHQYHHQPSLPLQIYTSPDYLLQMDLPSESAGKKLI